MWGGGRRIYWRLKEKKIKAKSDGVSTHNITQEQKGEVVGSRIATNGFLMHSLRVEDSQWREVIGISKEGGSEYFLQLLQLQLLIIQIIRRVEVLEIGEQIETIQTTALLRSTRILRRILKTWKDLLSLSLLWKTIKLRLSEKLARSKIIITIIIIIIIIVCI